MAPALTPREASSSCARLTTLLGVAGTTWAIGTEGSRATSFSGVISTPIDLVSFDCPADVHGGNLGTAARGLLGLVGAGLDLLLGNDGARGALALLRRLALSRLTLSGLGGGVLVVFDENTNTGASLASAKLDLGALDEGGLGVLQSAVETGQISLLAGGVGLGELDTRGDLLAHALEGGNGLSLGARNVMRVGTKVDVQGQGVKLSGQAGNGEDVTVDHIVDRFG
ncbi:hypothetical protein Ct61P_02851 [Colletotrichum tofieldiae]|nr:hypothetical protein Ct61P_02851 [Colletotrichum tofieldiae]